MRDVKQAVTIFSKLKENGKHLNYEDFLVMNTGPLRLTIQHSYLGMVRIWKSLL